MSSILIDVDRCLYKNQVLYIDIGTGWAGKVQELRLRHAHVRQHSARSATASGLKAMGDEQPIHPHAGKSSQIHDFLFFFSRIRILYPRKL